MRAAPRSHLIPKHGQMNGVDDGVKKNNMLVRPTCFLSGCLLGNSRCLEEGQVLSVFL